MYALPGDKESLPTLRACFLALAIKLRLSDVDAGVIRLAEPREFTQAIAAWLYDQTAPDGTPLAEVQSTSRRSLSRSTRTIASCKKRCGFTACGGHRAAES